MRLVKASPPIPSIRATMQSQEVVALPIRVPSPCKQVVPGFERFQFRGLSTSHMDAKHQYKAEYKTRHQGFSISKTRIDEQRESISGLNSLRINSVR
jgi:hypothetical protein